MDPGFSLPDPAFESISRLTLGTVQMGMDYGLAPRTQRPNDARAKAIFDHAWELGITCFDTARAYGDAEARIGHWLAKTGHAPLVVTKFPPVEDAAALEANLAESARALGRGFLDAVLAHRAGDLQNPDIANALRRARDEGRIGAFGASVYDPEEAEIALGVDGLAAIQVPLNAFDQRMAESGVLARAAAAGIAVFARSVFLQGLLLHDPDALPPFFTVLADPLARFQAVARAAGISPADLALGVALARPEITSAAIGMTEPAHLDANAEVLSQKTDQAVIDAAIDAGRGLPLDLVIPSRWPKS